MLRKQTERRPRGELARVLVVDDEADIRELLDLTVAPMGLSADCAASIAEARGILQRQSYQLCITDMRLPDGTGLELLKRLDAAKRREKTIVITAYGSDEGAVEALKAGAFDYLTKPVDLRQFRSVVASALGRAPTIAAATQAIAARDDARVAEAKPGADSARVLPALARLAGRSQAMQQVRSLTQSAIQRVREHTTKPNGILLISQTPTYKDWTAQLMA